MFLLRFHQSFFESFPLIYPVIYGFSLGTMGLAFVSVVVTTVLGAAGYMYYVYHYVEPRIRTSGLPPLESRLIPAIPASVLMPIGLFIFAWTSRESVHWMAGLVGIGIYSIGFYVFLQCVLLYIPLMVRFDAPFRFPSPSLLLSAISWSVSGLTSIPQNRMSFLLCHPPTQPTHSTPSMPPRCLPQTTSAAPR